MLVLCGVVLHMGALYGVLRTPYGVATQYLVQSSLYKIMNSRHFVPGDLIPPTSIVRLPPSSVISDRHCHYHFHQAVSQSSSNTQIYPPKPATKILLLTKFYLALVSVLPIRVPWPRHESYKPYPILTRVTLCRSLKL